MLKLYKKRRAVVRPLELFCEPDDVGNQQLKCWITGVPVDGRLMTKARFNQTRTTAHGGYTKMDF